jgi:mono/diheme cytochrome c family protein
VVIPSYHHRFVSRNKMTPKRPHLIARLPAPARALAAWPVVLLALVVLGVAALGAADPDPNAEAMRLLKNNCFSCHNDQKKKGGLVMTSRDALLHGGEDGKVVVEGAPEDSALIESLAADADPHMPPKKQLSPAQIATLNSWIKGGAKWNAAALVNPPSALRAVALAPLPASYRPVLALALSPDSTQLAVGCGNEVVIYNVTGATPSVVARASAHPDPVQSMAWSPDGKMLATGAYRRVVLWNLENLENVRSLAPERQITVGLTDRITAMRFLPDGAPLVIADGRIAESGTVRIADISNGAITASWPAHADTIFDLAVSGDGKILATAGGDKLVKMWDMATHKETARFEGHVAQVLTLAFDANATQLVSGGIDQQIKVWDVKTHERLNTLGTHTAAINAVAWAAAGNAVVAVTEAGSAFCYTEIQAASGVSATAAKSEAPKERALESADSALYCVAASANGERIFAGSHDGRVFAWNKAGKLIAKLNVNESPATASTANGSHDLRAEDRPADAPAREPAPAKRDQARNEAGVSLRGGNKTAVSKTAAPKIDEAEITELLAEPARIQLRVGEQAHVLITARLKTGFDVDATAAAALSAASQDVLKLEDGGVVRARQPGSATLTAALGNQRIEIPVEIQAATNDAPSFVRDALPVLSKAGCNAGACHAKPEGQNGFHLTVFSYDPKSDYDGIVKDARGRRVFPSCPEESLILLKATLTVPHEGGERFDKDSDAYRTLLRWIRSGLVYRAENEPVLEKISAFPSQRRYRKGATQRLLVRAHYSDGSERDVTALAGFVSNDKEMARVTDDGAVSIGKVSGEAVVVARYMGLVCDSRISVPADRLLPESQYADLPVNNFIDELAYAQFKRLGLFPSAPCTDAEFLRRASLDTIGALPTPEEARAFLDDTDPAKREKLIDRLLAHPFYADYWANKWADLLRPNSDRVGVKSAYVLDQWLRETFRENKPYDQFVRDIVLTEGNTHRYGPAVIYRDRREPADLTTMFSRLFLGVRMDCAKCHHHPNEKWSQDDFYHMAAFFGSLKQKGAPISTPISAGNETFYFVPQRTVKHPVTGELMDPKAPDGPLVKTALAIDPRRELADWMTDPKNPFFARAAANRVWEAFFGRGIVDPVDDFRNLNPPSNPALIDALGQELVRQRFDLKALMRTIMRSHLYQLSSAPNEFNGADTRNFSRAYRRRLPAETLADALADITGVPEAYPGMPPGSRAMQAWSYKIDSQTMDAFGRPNSSSDCPCERDVRPSIVQALHLMNSRLLQEKLGSAAGRVHSLAAGQLPPEGIVAELYLACYARQPTAEELQIATAPFAAEGAANGARQAATEDVLWSLLNSAEFVFNH